MSPDIFDKCMNFHEANDLKEAGVYPYFHRVESSQGPEIMVDGSKKVVVCSNNYLGLASHPKVIEASVEAVKKYGTSGTGSRFLNGTNDLHEKVEKKFSKFVGKEDAILFTTGHHSNLGAIASLVGKGEVVITDKLDHASIIDGCRLSFGEMARFRHNDMSDLERQLKKHHGKSMLIVVDGVFSMEGDIANLPEISRLAKQYNANVFVDEAHSLGVLYLLLKVNNHLNLILHCPLQDYINQLFFALSTHFHLVLKQYLLSDHATAGDWFHLVFQKNQNENIHLLKDFFSSNLHKRIDKNQL